MLPSANSAQLPPHCRPATAYRTPTGNAFFTGAIQAAHLHSPSTESHDNSLESHRNQLHPASQWTIAHWDLPPDQGLAISAAIINGTAKAVSDGSYKSGHSTAGFILLGSNKEQELEGVNTTPGATLEQSAYRAELSGVAGIASALSCLCKTHDITAGTITIGLDGEKALYALAKTATPLPTDASFDLIMDTRHNLANLPITIKWNWIKGHQDKKTPKHLLDEWAQLNIRMDK
ncbi:MAG TPA: hypothetical protein V6D20_01275, partial [Candidatus Obscuribacterales bacterium]